MKVNNDTSVIVLHKYLDNDTSEELNRIVDACILVIPNTFLDDT